MKFKNDSERVVKFKARGKDYSVEPKAIVSIPDDIAYIVESRKLPLVCAEAEDAKPVPVPSDPKPKK